MRFRFFFFRGFCDPRRNLETWLGPRRPFWHQKKNCSKQKSWVFDQISKTQNEVSVSTWKNVLSDFQNGKMKKMSVFHLIFVSFIFLRSANSGNLVWSHMTAHVLEIMLSSVAHLDKSECFVFFCVLVLFFSFDHLVKWCQMWKCHFLKCRVSKQPPFKMIAKTKLDEKAV